MPEQTNLAAVNNSGGCAREADAYKTHVQNYRDRYKPVGVRESELVQSLADLSWRTNRVVSLENNIYAMGRDQLQEEVIHCDAVERPALLELRTYLAYEKQLRNLQTQEARLRRYSARDAAELKALQAVRHAEEQARLAEAAEFYLIAKAAGESFHPAEHGFAFSNSQIEHFLQNRDVESRTQTAQSKSSLRMAA